MKRQAQFKIVAIAVAAALVMTVIAASGVNQQAYALTFNNAQQSITGNSLVNAQVQADVAVCGLAVLATGTTANC